MEKLKHMKDSLVACVESELCNLAQADTKELGEAIDMIKDLEEAMYYASITKAMHESEEVAKKAGVPVAAHTAAKAAEVAPAARAAEKEVMYYPYPMYYPIDKTVYYPAEEPMYYQDDDMMYYPRGSRGRYRTGRRGYAEAYDPARDLDREIGKMYYSGSGSSGGGQGGSSSGGGQGGNSSGGSQGGSSAGYEASARGNNARGGGTRGYEEREYTLPIDIRDSREGRSPMSRKGYMESKEMKQGKDKQIKELEKYMQELTTDITEMIQGSSPEEKQLMQKKIATLAEKVGQVNV